MEYTGYKEIEANHPLLSDFYSGTKRENLFDCYQNEYILVKDGDGEVVDKYRWDGNEYIRLNYKPLSNQFSGTIKPRNPQQCLAFDMLQNPNITVKVLSGCYGSGKTMLMVTHALDLIANGKVQKLLWVRNNVEVKDSVQLGSLPGDKLSKLIGFAGPLLDHIGGIDNLYSRIDQEQIEIEHLGFLRGRDLRNCIVLSSEAENLTSAHVQLMLGRIGENAQLWLDGDYSQVDRQVFKENSGMARIVERLSGNPLFGYVNLPITERSETARLADLLD